MFNAVNPAKMAINWSIDQRSLKARRDLETVRCLVDELLIESEITEFLMERQLAVCRMLFISILT